MAVVNRPNHKTPPGGEVDFATIEARVLAYMERVSGKTGQAAVDAWCKYVGWDDAGLNQLPIDVRIARACSNMMARRPIPTKG